MSMMYGCTHLYGIETTNKKFYNLIDLQLAKDAYFSVQDYISELERDEIGRCTDAYKLEEAMMFINDDWNCGYADLIAALCYWNYGARIDVCNTCKMYNKEYYYAGIAANSIFPWNNSTMLVTRENIDTTLGSVIDTLCGSGTWEREGFSCDYHIVEWCY